jgi:aryl-alcohol dehydrogenase-like predicted oxidoreductase
MGEGRTAKPEYVRRAVEASLSRLGTDSIDLYQLHFPDPNTPIAETLGALDELVVAGKVREIGCSNFNAEMLREAAGAVENGKASFSCVQNHLSLMERADESEGLAECEALGLAYLPYFPLANGLLTGKYSRGEPPPEGTRITANPARASQLLTDATFDQLERLAEFAAERGHSILDLAFAWLLSHPAVASVIAGASKPEQVAGNAGAAGWQLSEEDLGELSELLS